MTTLMWILFVSAVACLTFLITVNLYLVAMARRGVSGTEYLMIALIPLFMTFPAIMIAGGLSGLGLAGTSDRSAGGRMILGGTGIALLIMGGVPVILLVIEFLRNRKSR